jgi:hypothetical protein
MEALRQIVTKVNNEVKIQIPENMLAEKFEIIILPLENDSLQTEWKTSIFKNSSFGFLNTIEEDIYTLNDGKPYEHKR